MKQFNYIFLVSVFTVFLFSCVSKKKYNALGQYYQDVENKLIKSQRKVKKLEKELAYAKAFATDSIPKTTLKFEVMEHNFGTIKQESVHDFIFKFTNTGVEPLVIVAAKGSCGCTVPVFPKEKIMPGESGEIKIVYSSGHQEGSQNKKVTITANTEPETTFLFIKANVE